MVPTTSVLTFKLKLGVMSFCVKMCKLIKYLPLNNSQITVLSQKSNVLVGLKCSQKQSTILLWVWLIKHKSIHFAGHAPSMSTWCHYNYIQIASLSQERRKFAIALKVTTDVGAHHPTPLTLGGTMKNIIPHPLPLGGSSTQT